MIDPLRECLFPDDGAFTYAIIDGASCKELLPHLDDLQPEYFCLYAGELAPDIQEVAPYLVDLRVEHEFTDWLLAEGFGRHWGIFARSRADLRAVRKHFRTFLMVKSPEGKSLYFRYYDPRVFRIYLPTCNEKEIKLVCGPIQTYLMEGEASGSLLRFVPGRGKLETLDLRNSSTSRLADPLPDESEAQTTPSASGKVPPLRISDSQVATFSANERELFDQRMIAHLKRFFPDAVKPMKEDELRRFIADGIKRAGRYEIKSERNVCLFTDVMLMLGPTFDESPQYAWAATLLRSKRHPDEKMTALYHTASAHIEEKATA